MFSISSSEKSEENSSVYNESSIKQNDKLNINKIKEQSDKDNNNKSEIIHNRNKLLSIEKNSINHISLYIRNSADGNLTEKKSILTMNNKQSESESNNSSSRNRIKFVNMINNIQFHIMRRLPSLESEFNSFNSKFSNSSMKINNNCLVCEEELTEQEKKN